jgi:hypothetical protein
MRELLEPHAEELVAKVVEMAKSGDTAALRICIDRLIPPIKARDEPVAAPGLAGSLGDQGRAVLDALGAGTLTPDQAATMLTAIATQARIVEVDEIEKRVTALERTTNGAKA